MEEYDCYNNSYFLSLEQAVIAKGISFALAYSSSPTCRSAS